MNMHAEAVTHSQGHTQAQGGAMQGIDLGGADVVVFGQPSSVMRGIRNADAGVAHRQIRVMIFGMSDAGDGIHECHRAIEVLEFVATCQRSAVFAFLP